MRHTYPNQKRIISKKKVSKRDFLLIDNNDWFYAIKVLSPSAFGVYLYLSRLDMKSTIEEAWNLSRVDVIEKIGISVASYKNAIKELIEKGYLKVVKNNLFVFNTKTEWDNFCDFNGIKSIPEIEIMNNINNDILFASSENIMSQSEEIWEPEVEIIRIPSQSRKSKSTIS